MSNEPKNGEALEAFLCGLAELTVNSKPHINFLTMIAENNSYQAEAIVKAVNDRLKTTLCSTKLPILYLIDSILKNVGKEYITYFSTVLVNNFANIYAEVDASTKQLMGILRQTWNGIISPTDLSKLDIQVHTIDQQWQLPTDLKNTTIKILLNPNFLPQKFPSADSIEEKTPKPNQELSDEVDEAEILREQLLLEKKKRELSKLKMQVEKSIPENKNEQRPSSGGKMKGSSEAPIIIDLEPSDSQVDSTTVDRSPDLPTLDESPEMQPSVSTESLPLDKPSPDKQISGKLLELLTDLISKQNTKLKINENHQAEKPKGEEFCNEMVRPSGRYSGRNARRRSYKSSHKYRYPRNRSVESRNSYKYSSGRDEKNKSRYINKKCVPDSKLAPKDSPGDQSLPSSRANEDLSQSKGHAPKVSTSCKDCLDSSLSSSRHSPATQTSSEIILCESACSVLSSHNGGNHFYEQRQAFISQAQPPVDMYVNSGPVNERKFNHNSRESKKALLPTPRIPAMIFESPEPVCSTQSQSILSFQKIQIETNSFGMCHSTEQFSCTSSKKNEVVEIKLQKEIDYNHGFRCPENKLAIEHSNTSHQIRNNQSLFPPSRWYPYPSSPVNAESIPKQPLVNACLDDPLFSLPPASNFVLEKIAQDTVKTILVDNVTKKVHFYGEVAVIDSGENNPREITFKPGEAAISVNNVVVHTAFHHAGKEVFVRGKIFRVRLGAPTRELYVNDEAFQCQFNFPPEQIQLSCGEVLTVQLFSEATPLVQLGATRRDLVAGHVTLTIDGTLSLRILLHAKPQRFDIDGIPHILKFADALQTVIINDCAVNLKFGGHPILISVGGVKHELQLSNLPFDVNPGDVNINSMAQTGSEPYITPNDLCHEPLMPKVPCIKSNTCGREKRKQKFTTGDLAKKRKMASPPHTRMQNVCGESKSSEIPGIGEDSPAYYPNTNIHTLFQSLCEVGLLIPKNQLNCAEKVQSSDVEVHLVDFKDLLSLKRKQPGLVEILYSGLQCSSCGARFPAEMTEMYRQHLDWHFQQNHKVRYSTKCQSRLWYCSKQVWIQSEGHEVTVDIEDEPTSKECQSSSGENTSVPSHGYPPGAVCEMCGDVFDEFFDEDKDEWHLSHCLLFEKKLYHPACFNDHQASSKVASIEDSQLLLKDDTTTVNQTEICEDISKMGTDSADLVSETEGNQAQDESLEAEEKERTISDADKTGSPVLGGEEEPSEGDIKVDFLSSTKPSDDENTIEINNIKTNTVELNSDCEEAGTSSYPCITPTEIHVLTPADVCDNSTVVLEASLPNDNENKVLSLLENGSELSVCLKPKLIGRKLSHLPPASKGSEVSSLCSLS